MKSDAQFNEIFVRKGNRFLVDHMAVSVPYCFVLTHTHSSAGTIGPSITRGTTFKSWSRQATVSEP